LAKSRNFRSPKSNVKGRWGHFDCGRSARPTSGSALGEAPRRTEVVVYVSVYFSSIAYCIVACKAPCQCYFAFPIFVMIDKFSEFQTVNLLKANSTFFDVLRGS